MKLIKTGAAVLNQTALDWDNNQRNIVEALRQARAEGVTLLCLPELCITGYGCEDTFSSPAVLEMAWRVLQEILPESKGIVASVGLPLLFENRVYNAVALLVDGEIAGFVAKRNLAGDGLHYEPRWFKPWPEEFTASLRKDGMIYPLGDVVFEIGGVRIGFEICEDAWVGARPGIALARNGVDVILNPSASHFAFGKREVRKRFVLEGSRAFGVTYVYANLVGNEAGRAIYDGDALIATGGRLVALGRRFSYRPVTLTTAVIDIETTRTQQSQIASFQPRKETQRVEVVRDFVFPEQPPARRPPLESLLALPWEKGAFAKEEEFARAVSLALYDYMRKSWSKGFVVSMSGGADSAACACLVALMVRFAMAEIGEKELQTKLAFALGGAENAAKLGGDWRAYVHRLLLCAYQGTANSGKVTRNAAAGVAAAIGAEYHELEIENVAEGYRKMVEGAIGRPLDWATDDIALQNIQARVRSPGIWMFANIRGALLMSTSNRSEAAVGYATMDGDTSGGLCPIAGIDKAFLRKWLTWLEKTGPEGLEPIPELRLVNEQQPTAELRPPSEHQTDEADLMPYEVLDAIERMAIRDKKSPAECLELLAVEYPDFSHGDLLEWVKRFFRLWSRNQWKRERYAPSFHVDDKNLDPKTWCRFPILSGGYARELRELEQ